jgi:hypothetical protein
MRWAKGYERLIFIVFLRISFFAFVLLLLFMDVSLSLSLPHSLLFLETVCIDLMNDATSLGLSFRIDQLIYSNDFQYQLSIFRRRKKSETSARSRERERERESKSKATQTYDILT